MDKPLLQYLFDSMLKGKSFRLSEDGKSFWGNHSDQWGVILSIGCTGEITICGNNNTILRNAEIDHICHKFNPANET